MQSKQKNKGMTSGDRVNILSKIAGDDSLEPSIRVQAIKALDNLSDSEGMSSRYLLEIGVNKRSMIRYLAAMGIPKEDMVKILTTDDTLEMLKKVGELKKAGYVTTFKNPFTDEEEDKIVEELEGADKVEDDLVEQLESERERVEEEKETLRERKEAAAIEKKRQEEIDKLKKMAEDSVSEEEIEKELETIKKFEEKKEEPAKAEKKLFDEDFL